MKKLLLTLFALFTIYNLTYSQTTYYIDATGGNDSNNGITPQTAWRSLNKVNNYSFNTTSGNVYVRLKKGQVWRETLTPSRGGTGENNRVIFCSYGTGRRPQILGSNDLKSDISIWTDMGSNVWRRSLSSSPFYVIFEKPNTATNWGYIQSSSSACNSDYKFYYSSGYLYVYSVGNPASYYDKIEAPARAFAVGEITVRYITLDSLEIWGSQEACVRTSNGHYLTIQNCDIHHVGNVSVRDGGQGDLLYIISSNAVVRNNRIWEPGSHGIYQGMYNGYVGRNCLYEGNYIANCYYTMIDIQHTGSAGSTYGNAGGHIIRNNYLIGDSMAQGSIYNGAGAGIQVLGMRENGQNEWMKNIRIYNNVLVGMQWGINWTRVADSIQVYNNTFIDTDILMRETREDGWPSVSGYYTPPTKIWWKNNIVYRSSGSLISISNDTNKVFDNNLWYSSSGSPFNSGGSSRNFTQWKSWIKGDNNSVFANPMFVQYTNKSSAKDLRLQSTSPAINIGATLGVPYDRDKNGISRPQGNGYDAGAYEYTESSSGGGGGGTDITPPELQMAVLINPTTVELTFSEGVNQTAAENKGNYSITQGITVISSILLSTNKVKLTTTEHQSNINYTVTVNNLTDLSGNLISSIKNNLQYSLIGDFVSPELMNATLNNPYSLTLSFSEALEQVSATTSYNYKIDNNIVVTNTSISDDKKKVNLTTSFHSANKNYTVTVNGVKDLAGNLINLNKNSFIYSYSGDSTPPEVISAELIDSVNLEVIFSEAVDSIDAAKLSSYSIDNNVIVKNVKQSATLNKVILNTTPHRTGVLYTLVVKNLKDLAGNLISDQNKNSQQYLFANDISAPTITQLQLNNTKSITIRFNERIDPSSANNKSNYKISNGVIINQVQILPDSTSVLLKTSTQQANINYTLTVSNIKDRSNNVINPNPCNNVYKIIKSKGGKIQLSVLSAYSTTWAANYFPEKTIDGFGMSYPESRWKSNKTMPDTITYDLGETKSVDSIRISFYKAESGRLYKYSVYSSENNIVWKPVISDIWSEASEWSEIEFDSIKAHYIKLVIKESNQSSIASIWEFQSFGTKTITAYVDEKSKLTSFELAQNYPNPFNPSTKIQYSIPYLSDSEALKKQHVTLKIYDILGNEITTLVDDFVGSGVYEAEFNSSSVGQLSSGVYFYRLQAESFMETKKMILLR